MRLEPSRGARSPRSSYPQHVGHRIEARPLAAAPQGGFNGAAGEDAPVRRAVRQLDTLAVRGEDHGVLTDDVAAAQGREADIATLARPRMAVARAHAVLPERDLAPRGRRLAQHQRGAGG